MMADLVSEVAIVRAISLYLPYLSPISPLYLPAPILQSLQRATELKPASYKTWHEWAMINFEVVAQNDGARYVVPAVRGYLPYISPMSPLYLPYASTISPLYLPYISLTSPFISP